MPFVTEFVGPQQPVSSTPPLTAGVLRRTSTIDTHPVGTGDSEVDLRARDVLALEAGSVQVLDEIRVRARLAERVIDTIDATPPHARLAKLAGSRVGPGFRSAVAQTLPEEVRRASLLHLLLDDWVGAALVSGYATQVAAIVAGTEQPLPEGVADRLAGICAGFAPDASLIGYARRHDIVPSVVGPAAPPLDFDGRGLHEVKPLRAHGMRRYRRLDLRPGADGHAEFDAHFRDSHVDADGAETILHEYTLCGTLDTAARTLTEVQAQVRVLPWQECPGAIASAGRAQGMKLSEVRDRVRGEFVGTSTCTHLNDTVRAVADLDALLNY